MNRRDRPDLVLAVLDTTRAGDVLSAGLPAIEDLAAEGTTFGRAISPAPWTLPAHGSLFSGLLPFEHGLTGEVAVADGTVRPVTAMIRELSDRWLPVRLAEVGYRTFAASANPWITPRMGWGLGFDRFVESWVDRSLRFQVGGDERRVHRGERIPDPLAGVARRIIRAVRAVRAAEDSGATRSLAAFRTWSRAGDAAPRFALFNFMEAHLPYRPPRPFGPRAPRTRIRADHANRRLTNEFVVRYNVRRAELSEETLVMLRELYRAEIAYLDSRLADLAEELSRSGRDVVMVVVGDHGEHLGEHHLLGHQASLSDALLWVPLIVWDPTGRFGRGEVKKTVSTAWVPGTLLSAAGAAGDEPELFHRPGAESVLAWYESAYVEAAGARRLADGELVADPEAQRVLRSRSWACYRGARKFVARSDGTHSLYDLSTDPEEEIDLASDRPDLVEAFDDVALPFERKDVSRAGAREGPSGSELAEIERHLESLGYM